MFGNFFAPWRLCERTFSKHWNFRVNSRNESFLRHYLLRKLCVALLARGQKSSNAWKIEMVERDFQARSSVRGAPAPPFCALCVPRLWRGRLSRLKFPKA